MAVILPYITLAIFVVGMGYRFYVWAKTPSPGKITLFPAPGPGAATSWGVVKESFLFPSLFRGDKLLWTAAWIFHVTLAFIIIGHIRVFTDFPALWRALGIDADRMSAAMGGAAGLVIMTTVIVLLVRRVGLKRVREISNFADYFALLLVLAVIATGNLMRFGEHFDLAQTRALFRQVFTFSFADIQAPQSTFFLWHFVLVQLLIICIPFSKLLHFGGIFFTQTIIRRR
jgi:nitrate reductase gamma subunit